MRRLFVSSLGVRIMLLVLLAILPAMGLTIYSGLEERRQVLLRSQEEMLTQARNLAQVQESLIENARSILFTLAQTEEVKQRQKEKCSNLFARLLEKSRGRYSAFLASAPDGQVFAAAPRGAIPINLVDRPYFQKVLKDQTFTLSSYQIGRFSGLPTLAMARPVFDQTGQVTAVVITGLKLSWLNDYLSQVKLPQGATLTIIDRLGTILAQTPQEDVIGKIMAEAPLIQAMLNQHEGVVEAEGMTGRREIFGFATLETIDKGTFVAVGLPEDVAYAQVNRVMWRNLIFLGLLTVLGVGIAYVGGYGFILKHVRILVGATQRLAAGDLSARTDLKPGRGELAQLGEAFDHMATSLQSREEELKTLNLELEERVQQRTAELTETTQHLQREVEERRQAQEETRKIEWLLSKRPDEELLYQSPYGDLTALNRTRLILDAVGPEVLKDIVKDYIGLVDTSGAVYEKNGDYALGIFSSRWCRFMDEASWRLCGTDDNREALDSGKWGCHESCWTQASKTAIETGKPADIECFGGIRLFVAPIRAGGDIIGSVNVGYGSPPREPEKLAEIARKCQVEAAQLETLAWAYDHRPPYIIELAKNRVLSAARLIGEIVERRQAEKALAEKENFLASIFGSITNGIVVLDKDLNILRVNGQMEKWFSQSMPLVGKKCYEAFYGRKDPCELCPSRQALRTGKTSQAVIPRWGPQANINGWFDVLSYPLLDRDSGEVTGVVEAVRDITERLQAEEILRHSQQIIGINNEISKIFLTVPDNDMFTEVLNVVLTTLESTYGIFGYIDDQGALAVPTMTRDIWEQCDIPDKDIVFPRDSWGDSLWARAIREQRLLYANEPLTRYPAGHIPISRTMALPIIFQGEVIGLLLVANKETDYTDRDMELLQIIGGHVAPILQARLQRNREEKARQQAEEGLKKTLAELDRSNKELEQFASIASHDLQEPLRMISSYTQLLAQRYRGKLDQDADDFINYAVDGAKRLQQLINDLLAFSRVTTRGKPPTPTNVEEIFGRAVNNLQLTLAESGARLTHDPLPTVRSDGSQLLSVFQNLIGNAIKFQRKDAPAEIHVSAAHQDSQWIFSVKDNGIGIEPQYHQRIFQIFQRLQNRSEYDGTGIGLAVCKRIVERHKGRIWVESELGKGSTFYFAIPEEQEGN